MANEHAPLRMDAEVNPAAFALPAAAASTTYSASIDLGTTNPKLSKVELEIVAPALTVVQLPNGTTCTYGIQDSADNAAFSALATGIITQTGAGGAGAATDSDRVAIPSSCRRYVRAYAQTGGGTGNCSAASGYLRARFG